MTSNVFAKTTRSGGSEQQSERVARIVREAIMVGELKAPEYLRTEKLAADLAVSPTPVREALMILQAEGVVRWEPRKGYRVNRLTLRDVNDLFTVQASIAGELAARASLTLDDGEIGRLEELQSQLEEAAEAGDIETVDHLNFLIHRAINTSSGSARLAALLRQTVQYVPLGFWGRIDGWERASAHQHRPVFDALRLRDAEASRATMEAHIKDIGDLLAAYLTKQGFEQ